MISSMMLAAAQVVSGAPSVQDDATLVGRLDDEFQAAVKRNDAAVMDRILHPDFVLILGNGKSISRTALLEEARSGTYTYERQDEVPGSKTVRMFGPDTAVVTALLWSKGKYGAKPFEYRLWFSDTYVRTTTGWRYAFAQASSPLPAPAPAPSS